MITSQALASVENLLEQMRSVASQAQALPASRGVALAASGGAGFASELARSLERVSGAQNFADAQARAFELGDPDIALSNVMIDLQKASLAFQTSVTVRNRLVESYKEIANMAV